MMEIIVSVFLVILTCSSVAQTYLLYFIAVKLGVKEMSRNDDRQPTTEVSYA